MIPFFTCTESEEFKSDLPWDRSEELTVAACLTVQLPLLAEPHSLLAHHEEPQGGDVGGQAGLEPHSPPLCLTQLSTDIPPQQEPHAAVHLVPGGGGGGGGGEGPVAVPGDLQLAPPHLTPGHSEGLTELPDLAGPAGPGELLHPVGRTEPLADRGVTERPAALLTGAGAGGGETTGCSSSRHLHPASRPPVQTPQDISNKKSK